MAVECPIQAQENAEALLAYCARKLDPDTTAALENHMRQCAACREFRDTQTLLWTALDAWETAPVSDDFDRRLFRKLEERESAGLADRLLAAAGNLRWRTAAPLAAAGIVTLAVFLSGIPRQPDLAAQSQTETIDIEQVERTLEDIDVVRQLLITPPVETGAANPL